MTTHITHEEWLNAVKTLPKNHDMRPNEIANVALDLRANAQQPLISAEEARKLGAGKAEYFSAATGWNVCQASCTYEKDFQYCAIKQLEPAQPFSLNATIFIPKRKDADTQAQPEPVDPHAALRAEYAKQIAEGTTGFHLWEASALPNKWTDIGIPDWSLNLQYRCTDISCIVSKDGEPAIRMLRTEAQALQRQTKDTHDWFAMNEQRAFKKITPSCPMWNETKESETK